MNNKDFIAELANRTGNSKQMTQKMVLSVMESLVSQIEEDGVVQIPLFGTFEMKKRLERILVNPNNGKKMLVPPKLVLGFKPATAWKEEINKGGTDNG
jgi:DNA-binding protein HU-beta